MRKSKLYSVNTRAEIISRACDRLVKTGIAGLIALTPLAFGSVYPWAYCVMEAAIFLLVAVWMMKLLLSRYSFPLPSIDISIVLFVTLVGMQLTPLPPLVIRVIAPRTFETYQKTQPGWPDKIRPIALTNLSRAGSTGFVLLPTVQEVKQGASIPFGDQSGNAATAEKQAEVSNVTGSDWRTVTMAPSTTRTGLVKLVAYAGLFALLVNYQFERRRADDDDSGFYRMIVIAISSTATAVSLIALVQGEWWNGKVLGILIPYDWVVARPEIHHAGGPFVDPDHLANYLAMVLPLTVAGAIARNSTVRGTRQVMFRVSCCCALLIISAALMLTLSRGGWLGAVSGLSVFVWLMRARVGASCAFIGRSFRVASAAVFFAGIIAVGVIASIVIGAAGRNRIDTRLEQTMVHQTSLTERAMLWQDSLGMVRDFPILGVGLGCWPELFPRYHRPPWRRGRFLEAHNDYLQIVAETGLIGFALIAWVFVRVVLRPFVRIASVAPTARVTFAALIAGSAAMMVHELCDFSLQIPSNALLFVVIVGLANRLALAPDSKPMTSLWTRRVAAGGIAACAAVLTFAALGQTKVPDAYRTAPATADEAARLVGSHPTDSFAHLALANSLRDSASTEDRSRQLEIALLLDPNNPFARDAYASVLLQGNRVGEGLNQLTTSVFLAPSIYDHYYLAQRAIPWLSTDEQTAVEYGLRRAQARRYAGALEALANVYASLGQFAELAEIYNDAASKQSDRVARANYLIEAGQAYVQARRPDEAEASFREAALAAPSDPRPYHLLAISIFASRNDLRSAKAVIDQGIRNGADPYVMALSLAEAAERVGDLSGAEAALSRAVMLQPSSFETRIRLGLLYLGEGKYDRAALVMRKAADLNPQSGDAFFNLGRAEEGRYQYFAAGKAYTRALELEPENAVFRDHYREFRRKLRNDAGA